MIKTFALLLLIPIISFSQEPAEGIFPIKDGEIYYEKVEKFDSLGKDILYKGIKSWGVTAFKSQKDVLQADDKESGLIAYKFLFTEIYTIPPEYGVKGSAEWTYNATMKILIKDDKIKIAVQNLTVSQQGISLPILTFNAESEKQFEKAIADNKGVEKSMRKLYTPERRAATFRETQSNFKKANASIRALIESLISYLEKAKSEFDF